MSLVENPFDWKRTKSGKLLVYRSGKLIMTVSGKRADAAAAMLGVDPEADQQLLARLTGNYKHGNERLPGSKRR